MQIYYIAAACLGNEISCICNLIAIEPIHKKEKSKAVLFRMDDRKDMYLPDMRFSSLRKICTSYLHGTIIKRMQKRNLHYFGPVDGTIGRRKV